MANQSSNKQNGRVPMNAPDPEVVPRATRRQFSAAYKRQVVTEADACTRPGEIGALLRRKGLYSSHLSNWRRQIAAGTMNDQRPGRPAEPMAAENVRLRQENERLRRELEKTQLIVEAQKKLAQVLDMMGGAMVHYGLADTIRDQRNQVLQAAYAAYPERFVRGVPTVPDLPREVWINQPVGALSTVDIAL